MADKEEYNSIHDGPTFDAAVTRASEGGSIDAAINAKPNQNLLDNWYFGNPVNQRNVSGAIDAVGYFLDRWKLVSGSVTIGSNGIILNGTIVQILETAVCADVTESALTTEGVVVASYDNNSKTISLTGTGQTFVAAKLELCSTQTLAHQDENGNWQLNEIPDYGEQLRRCQRYFWRSWTGERNTHNSILGVVFTNNNRITGFDYPVEMRTKPSITVYGLTGANKVTEWDSDADYGPASPAYWDTQRCIALGCDGAGLSNDNRVYYFIEANAEL